MVTGIFATIHGLLLSHIRTNRKERACEGVFDGFPSCSGKGHAGSHGHPIEGLAARGDSTLANATVHRTVAPGFGNSLSRAKPELVSNPPKSKIPPPKGDGTFGASLGIRTPDTLLKRQVLYLLS